MNTAARRRIALDFDDTLVPTRQALIDFFNARFNTSHTWDEMTEYRFRAPWPLTDEMFVELFTANIERFHDLPPLPGLLETLQAWAPAELHVITGRPDYWIPAAVEWLQRVGIDVAAVHSCVDLAAKGRLGANLGITLAVEDHAPAALSFAIEGIETYLLDAPYNQAPSHPRIRRVKNWDEIRTLSCPIKG